MKLSEIMQLTGLIEVRWKGVTPPSLKGGYELRSGNNWIPIESDDKQKLVSGEELAKYQGAIFWNKETVR